MRRLYHGEKGNPSPETLLKIWLGIATDPRLIARDPTFVEGFQQLVYAAGLSRSATLT